MAKRSRSKSNVHSWRLCPAGEHWVRRHSLHIPPSKKNPQGSITSRAAHCHGNASHKDSIYSDDFNEIANQYFSDLIGPPTANALKFKNGSKYDSLIRGWTKYWNEIFKPKEALDPDLVKALIATESGFRTSISTRVGKTKNKAHGLMQVTDESHKILSNSKGELTDYLVHVDQKELSDPNLNICAGIRWLFRKKQIADIEAGHELSWLEAIQKYKAEKQGDKLINKVVDYYEKLKGNTK